MKKTKFGDVMNGMVIVGESCSYMGGGDKEVFSFSFFEVNRTCIVLLL